MINRHHINKDGQFQSDKYPTCPPGKVPLSVKDPMATDLLWQYAQRRRAVDPDFSNDLEFALTAAGYKKDEFIGYDRHRSLLLGEPTRSKPHGHGIPPLTEHQMLVTVATMALEMPDLKGHDILDAFKNLGYASVIKEARNEPATLLTPDCCNVCDSTKASCDSGRVKCCLNCTHR